MAVLKLKGREPIQLPGSTVKSTSNGRFFMNLMANQGHLPDSLEDERLDWQEIAEPLIQREKVVEDEIATHHITPILSSATEMFLRQPLSIAPNITGLFTRVRAKGLRTEMMVGALGAVTAGDYGESGAPPEVSFQIGGDAQVVTIGKSGIQASWTDEALRYSDWPLMALNLNLMRDAMTRHKEAKALKLMRSLGTSAFDNAEPATSLFGVTTGRDFEMAANATVRVEDLIKIFVHSAEVGFPVDTLILHPRFLWLWFEDPVFRNILLAGGSGQYFNMFTGNPGGLTPWPNLGGRGPSNGRSVIPYNTPSGSTVTPAVDLFPGADSAPSLPGYSPFRLNIIVSPLMAFDTEENTGDIMVVKRDSVGLLFEDEGEQVTEWRDDDRELTKLRIKDRYAFGIMHEAQAVYVMKNVKAESNRFDGSVKVNSTAAIEEIPPGTALV